MAPKDKHRQRSPSRRRHTSDRDAQRQARRADEQRNRESRRYREETHESEEDGSGSDEESRSEQSDDRRRPGSGRASNRGQERPSMNPGSGSYRGEVRRAPPPQPRGSNDNVAGPSGRNQRTTSIVYSTEPELGRYSGSTAAALVPGMAAASLGSTHSRSGRSKAVEPQTGKSAELVYSTRTADNSIYYRTKDRATGVASNYSIAPSKKKATIRGPRKDEESEEEEERTFKDHKQSRHPKRDYALGNVIEVLLVPPPSDKSTIAPMTTSGYWIEGTSVLRRRYVVIRPYTTPGGGFQALPIKTNNGRGVEGLTNKWHYCVIYTQQPHPRPNPPVPNPGEHPQRIPGTNHLERPMQTQAILVEPRRAGDALDPMSRLDFFDVTPFEETADRVRVFGNVHRDYVGILHFQYEAVWAGINAHMHARAAHAAPAAAVEAAIPIAELQEWYETLRARAAQLQLTQPARLSAEDARRYAGSHELRQQLSNRLQAQWTQEMQRRRQRAAQREGDEEEEEEEEDEEEEDDEEESSGE